MAATTNTHSKSGPFARKRDTLPGALERDAARAAFTANRRTMPEMPTVRVEFWPQRSQVTKWNSVHLAWVLIRNEIAMVD